MEADFCPSCFYHCAHAAGSYSFVGLLAKSKTYDDLALPVQRRVLFAGEHTCKVLPAPSLHSMHVCGGAWCMY